MLRSSTTNAMSLLCAAIGFFYRAMLSVNCFCTFTISIGDQGVRPNNGQIQDRSTQIGLAQQLRFGGGARTVFQLLRVVYARIVL